MRRMRLEAGEESPNHKYHAGYRNQGTLRQEEKIQYVKNRTERMCNVCGNHGYIDCLQSSLDILSGVSKT